MVSPAVIKITVQIKPTYEVYWRLTFFILMYTRFTFFRVKLYIKERLTTERVSKINKEIKPYSVSCF